MGTPLPEVRGAYSLTGDANLRSSLYGKEKQGVEAMLGSMTKGSGAPVCFSALDKAIKTFRLYDGRGNCAPLQSKPSPLNSRHFSKTRNPLFWT